MMPGARHRPGRLAWVTLALKRGQGRAGAELQRLTEYRARGRRAMIRTFTRFPERRLEWVLAIYTLGLGLWLSMPAHSMNANSFVGALRLLPESGWGAIYIIVGVAHFAALHVDGRGWWTAFVRLAAVGINSQVFLALARGLITSNAWGTGVYTYGALGILFCGVAGWMASIDCGKELEIWRHQRQAAKDNRGQA